MKKTIGILLSALALISFQACRDDDFLTEHPKYFYTLDNAFTTPAQVEQAVVHLYSHLRSLYIISNENNTFFAYRGGNGTDMFDVSSIRHQFQFNDYSNLTPERSEYDGIYSHWYKMVSYANLVLYATSLKEIDWDSEQDRLYAEAQARFFRAWAYRNLGEEFGGVPIVTEFSAEPRYDFVRATREATYQFAIDELLDILDDLPETGERGRVVRGAAQHTLCQLYLDLGIVLEQSGDSARAQEAYRESVKWGDVLIDGDRYCLMSGRFGTRRTESPKFYYSHDAAGQTEEHSYESAGVKMSGNVFWDLFQMGNQDYQDGNRESIFVVRTDYGAYMAEDKVSRLPYSRMFSPTFRDPQAGVLDGTMEDVGGRGVTWVMPTAYTRDIIFEGQWASDLRNSESVLRRSFVGNVPGSKYYGKVIPWSVLYKDGQSQSVRDAAYTQCFPISCKVQMDSYVDDAEGGNKSNIYRDDYVIRLAETILLRAEAKFRLGDAASAASDLNLLRRRAQCLHMIGEDEMSLDMILDERARELMYEEIRWNTLLRMGGTVAVDRIREYSYWDYPRSGTMKTFNLWPIPQSVIDTNKDVLIEQNEGWN